MRTYRRHGRRPASTGITLVLAVVVSAVGLGAVGVPPAAASTAFASVTAGENHTCALTSAGAVGCWGYNEYGQLGNGGNTTSNVPVSVAGLSSGVTAITAGGLHACAVTAAGGVKCWGYNGFGQLGNNTNDNSNVPVAVSGLSGVTAISAGYYHTCALTSGGGVKCWGYNGSGQLGNNTNNDSNVPVDVSGLSSGVTVVEAGWDHTCAVTSEGGLKCWGSNGNGKLGDGDPGNSNKYAPVNVSGLSSGATDVSAGTTHTCAVSSGGAKCWGFNDGGQLGNSTLTGSNVPVDVSGLSSGVAGVYAGDSHTCARTSAGEAKCWGANGYGQLGDGTNTSSNVPVDVSGLSSGVAALSAGSMHTCAVTTAGGAKCWGSNGLGELGNGTTTNSTVPVAVVDGFRPSAPTNVTAGAGDANAAVSWAAPASYGDSPISSYTVTCAPSCGTGSTVNGTTYSATVAGLTNDVAYTFTVSATNAAGPGPGATSNAVTPRLSQPPAQATSAQATPTATQDAVVSTSPAGTAPTTDNPMITSVRVPAGGTGGTVSIAESSPSQPSVSTGGASYAVVGQQVDITAPAQSASNPLQLTFDIDASAIAGRDPATIWMLRSETVNGVTTTQKVDPCTATSPSISPDPCMTSRSVDPTTGDMTLVIATSHASLWRGGSQGSSTGGATKEDTDAAVAYKGWKGVADSAANGGSYRTSSLTADTVSYTTPTSTSLTWVTRKGPDQGKATVTIDGVAKGTFDLYAANSASFSVPFTGLASKAHTVVVKVLGQRNSSSNGTAVAVDAFVVGTTTTQDSSVKLAWSGWKGATFASASGGSYRFATAASSYASLTFTGTGVDLVTAKGPGYGVVKVYIDNVLKATVDLYSASQAWKTKLAYTGLAAGTHTIKVQPAGTKNASSTSTKVVLDAFVVH